MKIAAGMDSMASTDVQAFIATFEGLLDEQISAQVKMLIRANDLVALAAAAQQPRPRRKTCWPAWTCPACFSVATPMRAMRPYSARLRSCHREFVSLPGVTHFGGLMQSAWFCRRCSIF
jgi:C4-type Zn-finger protein